ncbi:GntP family permease [Methanocalculus taiwanensis]|uniref:GntP family permease n=1 Tax=Methanocalculus taiwanensis TaxID=106207 RepID=A0ABD4TQK5_9EURY|nr:GntP family permease [Methanocalculus taiwanensis]
METLSAFLICILAITIATAHFRFPPFPVLFGAAIGYGILAGIPFEIIIDAASLGAGRIFTILGVAVWGGSIIAFSLARGGGIQRILADLHSISSRPAVYAGLAGWLLAVPFMCAITPFLLLAPLLKGITADPEKAGILLSLAAAGSVLSFVLVAPAPVMATLIQVFSTDPGLNHITIPLSLILLLLMIILSGRGIRMEKEKDERGDQTRRSAAWAPIIVPIAIIGIGLLLPGMGAETILPVALLSGAIIAVLLIAGPLRREAMSKGTKHAGIIIFDLCGAGALGGVIAASSFSTDAASLLGTVIPLAVIPFILACFIQTAQGSRLVTAVITADIIAGTAIPDLIPSSALFLMIAAGTMVISYASDPFFWLVNRTTHQSVSETVKTFTLPLATAGCVVFGIAILLI